MKRFVILIAVFFIFGITAAAYSAETGKLDLKPGDKVYVCGWGKGCDCDSMSLKPGKCTCGKTLIQGKVSSVGTGTAVVKMGKKEKEFKTIGAYACACGDGCNCNTISQKPGKCVCGKTMKKTTDKVAAIQ